MKINFTTGRQLFQSFDLAFGALSKYLGLLIGSALILLTPSPGFGQGNYLTDGGYQVNFVDYEHDLANCKTYFYYEVYNNNVDPAISHFGFGESSCQATCLDEISSSDYGSWSYDNDDFDRNPGGGNAWQGSDPSNGICGIKFDKSLTNNNSQKVYLGVDGIQHPGLVNYYVKASTDLFQTSIPGPANCSGECDALKFNKTISQDTVVEGGTVTYRFEFEKIWNHPLTNFTFVDTLKNGLLWDSEPINITGGVILGATSLSGESIANFTIVDLPVGFSSFEIKARLPEPYSGATAYQNQAWVTDLPEVLDGYRVSDDPDSPDPDDPTILFVLKETDCIGSWNVPQISADFAWNYLSVDVNSTRTLMNVVLKFSDGSTEIFNGLSFKTGSFAGTGENEGKCIVGLWVRTACNLSGEGPEYGEYRENRYWDGLCITDNVPIVIEVDSEHGSTVLNGNGPQLLGWNGASGNSGNTGDTDDGGHNSTGVGIPQPEIPGRDRTINLPESELSVYPNPARATARLKVKGLDSGEWTLHIYTVSGRYLNAQLIQANGEINIAQLNLVSGIYLLQFENGLEQQSFKLIIQE